MKKKKLLGKIVSLILAAALTVTALPTTGMEVQAAEQVQTETGTTEDESAQYKDEEKSEEAQSKEEEKTSEAESEEEKNSEVESEEEEKSSEAESETEKKSSEVEEPSQEESEVEDLREVVGDMDVKLHVYNGEDGGLGYDEVYFQYWQAGSAEITNATEEYFKEWNCNRYKLTDEGNDWYGITMKGSMQGFNLLNSDGSKQINGFESKMTEFQGELWYRNEALYTDNACTTRLTPIPTDLTFLLVGEFPGTAWDQTAKPNFVKEGETSKYSITIKSVPAKTYSYKILQNPEIYGWKKPWSADENNLTYTLDATADLTITIDADDESKSVDIKKTYVKDIVVELPKSAQKGKETVLSTTGIYYKGDGTKTENVAITYKVSDVTKEAGASITEDGKLSVDADYADETVTFTAVYEDFEKEFTINVVDTMYKYTIYYYNPDYTKDTLDLWLWNKEGTGATEGTLFTGEEVLEDGNNWIKADLELSYTSLGIIPRSKGAWDYKDKERYYVNKTAAEETTLYIVADDPVIYTTLPEIKVAEKRYLIVEYKRNDGSAKNWCFYTWNNGFGNNFYQFVEANGSWIATIPVKPGISTVSYCIERDEVAEDGTVIKNWAEKDGDDYTCAMPEDQTVVKVIQEEGKGITKTYPYNVGYKLAPKDKKIHFYYRNNDKFLAGNTNQYASVAVEINGKEYPMTFDEENQRYAYDLENLEKGTYKYRYVLKETEEGEKVYELDRYNEKTVTEKVEDTDVKYSVVEYGSFNPVVSASVYRDSMDYNDNNVLTVKINAEKNDDIEGMEVAKVTADLSALGGSSEAEIDPELLELTISVKQGISAGVKTIPVTFFDQFQNEYTANTSVTVTDRNKGGDFDWDEAVIYFAVTDRFFDGNSSNNGTGYDKSAETGSSSYHGGDFAGMTQKLDYLKELGVNTIWITPIVANDMADGLSTSAAGVKSWGYHGYWASDFEKLDSHLGTEEEFSTLLNEAHNRGMKIMVDVVLNHSGYDQEEKFNNILKDEEGNAIPMIRDDSQMVSGSDQKYSLSGLPDFLTENKEVRELLVEWQSNWISKYPIDYYRVDTVKHVDDTTWSAFKNALTKINPRFKMIGEWAGAGYATDTGMLRTGRMDSLLDFDFNNKATDFVTGNISGTEGFLCSRNGAIDNTATLGQFIGSHDEDGFVYHLYTTENEGKGLPKEKAEALGKVAASLQITAKGQPVIYYGEEIGLTGANDYPYQTNRYDFDWSKVTDDNQTLEHYKKLLEIRNQYTEVFAKGSRNTIAANNDNKYDIFARSYAGTTLYVGLNIADTENTATFKLPVGVYCDLYGKTYYNTDNDGNITVKIPAAKDGGTVILVASERGLNIDKIPDQVYTGSKITLSADALKVRNGVEELTAGKDYTVDYKNNTNVGTATVIIKGKGNYTDQLTAEFTIVPKNIGEADVTLTYTDKLVYNKKKAQNAAPKLKYGKVALKENKDYTVTYFSKEDVKRETALSSIKEVGTYVMVITAKEPGNYTGSIEKDITIANKTLIKGASVKLSASSVSYKDCLDGKYPTVTELKLKGKVIENTRYDVTYNWNGSVGTAAVTITIKDADTEYMGSVSKTFKVTGEALKTVASVNKDTIKDVIFDKAAAKTDAGITQENPALKAKDEGVTLVAGRDYTVSYKNNKKAGTATVTFTGIGAYTGSLTATFKILVKELKEDDTKLSVNCASEAVYAKSGSKPAITVSYDGVALDASDFKVVYKNNTKVTDNAQAIITFQGSYKGKVTKNFRIGKNTLANMTVTAKDVMYNKKPGKTFATPVVKDPQGKTLSAGKDFDKKYQYTYVNATTVKNNGQDVSRAAGAQVDSKDIVPVGALIRVTVVSAQNGNYVGENAAVYRVMAGDIAKATIKIADKVYTGYAVTLKAEDFKQIKLNGVTYEVTAINGNQISLVGKGSKAIEGGLEIVSYTNNVNKGTAKITLKGTGSLGGTVTKSFNIKAKNAKNNWFNRLTSIFSR